MNKPILVAKFGTSCLMENGVLCYDHFRNIARQLCQLEDYSPVVVTSGAIQAGREALEIQGIDIAKPTDELLASISLELYILWRRAFQQFGKMMSGPILLTANDIDSRINSEHIASVIQDCVNNRFIPVINANDVVNSDEIKAMIQGVSENDFLTYEVAKMMDAKVVYFATEHDGIYDRNPSDPQAEIIRLLPFQDYQEMLKSGYLEGASENGQGGAIKKLEAAFKCFDLGPRVGVNIGNIYNISNFVAGKIVGTRIVTKLD